MISRAKLNLVVLNLAILLAVSWGVVKTWALYENTLLSHDEWITTKPALEVPVLAAVAFYSTPQALSRNRLNLDAWLGFEEVLTRTPRNLELMEFDFRLEADGYINALFDHRDGRLSGVRFSTRTDFPNAVFHATTDGEFTAFEAVLGMPVTPGVWHRGRIEFTDAAATITVDGERFAVLDRTPGPQRIGFRGGQRGGWIDDVLLTEENGETYAENFTNTNRVYLRFVIVFGSLLLLTLSGAFISRKLSRGSEREVSMAVVMLSMSVAMLLACAYGYQYLKGDSYWLRNDESTRAEEDFWIQSARGVIVERVHSQYTNAIPAGIVRLLALGGSQTWGSGASTDADTWARELESELNRADESRRFQVVNAGVSGFVAGEVLDLVRNELAGWQATAAVITVSSNDMDVSEFSANLEQLVVELNSRSIRPILVLEANSVERKPTDSQHGDLSAKHAVMRNVASRYSLPVIDMHAYLADRSDDGFLWWDFVHLTDFGQQLVAEKLAQEIPPLLGID